MSGAKEKLAHVQAEIRAACAEAGRDFSSVKLLAVGKTKPWESIAELAEAGQTEFGENYVQEALEKQNSALAWSKDDSERALVVSKIRWHFIGALQSNKAKAIPGKFSLIHSLDRLSLAQALDKAAGPAGHPVSALVQINLDAEASKAGLSPEKLLPFLDCCRAFRNLKIEGLMCIPDPALHAADPRRPFARLRELRDQALSAGVYPGDLPELSMGMSADFRAAILEGSTIVRVGTALFGSREPKK